MLLLVEYINNWWQKNNLVKQNFIKNKRRYIKTNQLYWFKAIIT